MTGSARQTDAGTLQARRFGREGLTLRFSATGFGTRATDDTDDNPQAQLSIAGSMIAV